MGSVLAPVDQLHRASSWETKQCLLSLLPLHLSAIVTRITPPAYALEWAPWLEALGFIPGVRVRPVARPVGGGAIAVQVGEGRFALSGEEAACIEVNLLAD